MSNVCVCVVERAIEHIEEKNNICTASVFVYWFQVKWAFNAWPFQNSINSHVTSRRRIKLMNVLGCAEMKY